jgi:hypothetical protein
MILCHARARDKNGDKWLFNKGYVLYIVDLAFKRIHARVAIDGIIIIYHLVNVIIVEMYAHLNL